MRLRAAPRERAERRGTALVSRLGGSSRRWCHGAGGRGCRPEHQLHDLFLGAGAWGDVDHPDRAALAKDRGLVAQPCDLEHAMGNEDDRPRRPVVFGDHIEDACGQVGRQRGGHFVEEQHVRLDRKRPRQVDHPQRRQGQVARMGAQVEVRDPQVSDARAERIDGGLGQREVLGDGQVRDDRRFLVDRHHARSPRLSGRVDDALLPAKANRAAVGPDRPGENLDEGALAGSVRPHEGVDLPGSNGKRGIAQRGDRAVALLDAGGLEQEIRHRLRVPVCGMGRGRRHRAGAPVIGVRWSEG